MAGVCNPTEERVYRQRLAALAEELVSFSVPLSSAKTLVARSLSHLELVPVGFGAYTARPSS
ncbi:hypothetical protein BH18ACT13_BH18ACT13_09360 [soil metagenome]